jgi:hypothetical protein
MACEAAVSVRGTMSEQEVQQAADRVEQELTLDDIEELSRGGS